MIPLKLCKPLKAAIKVLFFHGTAYPAGDAAILTDENSNRWTHNFIGSTDLHVVIKAGGKSDAVLSDKFSSVGFSVFDKDTHELHPFVFYRLVNLGYSRSLLPALGSP
jgi:hypothetical protein